MDGPATANVAKKTGNTPQNCRERMHVNRPATVSVAKARGSLIMNNKWLVAQAPAKRLVCFRRRRRLRRPRRCFSNSVVMVVGGFLVGGGGAAGAFGGVGGGVVGGVFYKYSVKVGHFSRKISGFLSKHVISNVG